MADRIEEFILRLKNKTQEGKLKWKVLSQFSEWDRIKNEIEKSTRVNLKNFYIDDEKSYCMNKNNGYVILLYVRYSKAPIFSPALDKCILLVKMNEHNEQTGIGSIIFVDFVLPIIKMVAGSLGICIIYYINTLWI